MIINISQILLYQTCPRKWYYRYVEQLDGAVGQALQEGKDFHAVVAGERPILPGDPLWLREGADEWAREWPTWGGEIVARELELRAPLGSHVLLGRLDALAKWNDMAWHVQYKSVRDSQPIKAFAKLIDRSLHEAAYARLYEVNKPLDLPYGGTILVMVRKLRTAGRAPFVHIQPLPIVDNGRIKEIEQMASVLTAEGHAPPLQHRSACMGGFGNSPCVYLPLCEGAVADFREAGLAKRDPFEGYAK